MSKTLNFTRSKCGFIIKTPYAEQAAVEHMKTHSNGKTLRSTKSKQELIKFQKKLK